MGALEPIAADEVHLWLLDSRLPFSDGELSRYVELLAPLERQRLQRIVQPPRRREFILSRALLRDTLSRYEPGAQQAWRFAEDHRGHPFQASSLTPASVRFSLAATQSLIACAVARHEVGVDVEWLGRRVHAGRVSQRAMSSFEREALLAIPEPDRRSRFFDLWTLKAAFLEARRPRRPEPMRNVTLLGGSAGADHLVTELADAQTGTWRLFVLSPTAENRAAVAVHAPSARLVPRWTVPLGLNPGAPSLAGVRWLRSASVPPRGRRVRRPSGTTLSPSRPAR